MSSFRERVPKWAVLFSLSILFSTTNVLAQAVPETPKEKPAAVPQEKPAEPPNAAQIELLETKYRFEANGDSRKEVHALVKINSELGVRQFARLNFDYNRSFQSVEIPLVHITHASGGTADILPSAITDAPNPAVEKFPAYQDVRIKSVRILGLEPGDTLEYRVWTKTAHNLLVPSFWLDHSFDRTGVVTSETFEMELPDLPQLQLRINPSTSPTTTDKGLEAAAGRVTYRWRIFEPFKLAPRLNDSQASEDAEPDVTISTTTWESLSVHLDGGLTPGAKLLESMKTVEESMKELSRRDEKQDGEVIEKAKELANGARTARQTAEAIYSFVSQKIATVDLPLGAAGFVSRPPKDILTSGYATQEDKFVLFSAQEESGPTHSLQAFVDSVGRQERPRLLARSELGSSTVWSDSGELRELRSYSKSCVPRHEFNRPCVGKTESGSSFPFNPTRFERCCFGF